MRTLCNAVMTSVEAFLQVPGTQLQHIEPTLRQLLSDLKKAGITPPADLDDLIEHAALSRIEEMWEACMYRAAEPEEDWFDMMSEEDQEAYMEWEARNGMYDGSDFI